MNKQRSSTEQMLLFLTLAFGAMMIWQQMHPSQTKKAVPDRPALTLAQAFQGIDPAQGSPLTLAAAANQKPLLAADVAANPKDPRSAWDNLRLGLIDQYVLVPAQLFKGVDRAQGPLMTPAAAKAENAALEAALKANPNDPRAAWDKLRTGLLTQYLTQPKDTVAAVPYYTAVIYANHSDDIQAQAYYQKGDFLWHQTGGDTAQEKSDAVGAFENLIRRGRGASAFISDRIYVQAWPIAGAPHFDLLKVDDLHGTIAQPDPNGILDRLDAYYSPKFLYVAFNSLVRLLGDNPTWSVGMAILIFAFFTRFAMQPLNKKQYESMKGMALIAPEMKKIQEKYKGKTEGQVQQMKEIRELQQAHGVNPMMGCGLAVLQMPIFFVVVYPLINYYTPRMELMGASFLWVRNLAHPDIALLVMYALSMFVSVRLSAVPATDDMQRQQQQLMSFVMPVMFPFMLKSYPSAFILYWMMFNVLSMFFQYRMMKAADPTKTLMTSLFGGGGAPAAKTVDSVPARPKSDSGQGRVKSISAGTQPAPADAPGKRPRGDARNGSANGAAGKNGSGVLGQLEGVAAGAAETVSDDSTGHTNGGAPSGAASPDSKKPGNAQRARRRRRY